MRFCSVTSALHGSIGVEGRELFQIYDIAFLQREVLGHLVEFHQLLGLESHASGDLVETVVILSVYIDQTVGTIDLIIEHRKILLIWSILCIGIRSALSLTGFLPTSRRTHTVLADLTVQAVMNMKIPVSVNTRNGVHISSITADMR